MTLNGQKFCNGSWQEYGDEHSSCYQVQEINACTNIYSTAQPEKWDPALVLRQKDLHSAHPGRNLFGSEGGRESSPAGIGLRNSSSRRQGAQMLQQRNPGSEGAASEHLTWIFKIQLSRLLFYPTLKTSILKAIDSCSLAVLPIIRCPKHTTFYVHVRFPSAKPGLVHCQRGSFFFSSYTMSFLDLVTNHNIAFHEV